jgi:predicted transcriptional regulator
LTDTVAPHLKALFQGLDLTIFAYGVTGTGKTHTMRGGLKLADRGVIPRLLSGVFRRGKKLAKDSAGATNVQVALSYYEIYNDKVYDLLEPPEKRMPAGLPLREKDGKTFVVGLSERACEDLRDFEKLYIEANNHRVTAATKLNAHSSRSHAILRVKLTQTTGDEVRESTASAIDLAGSEDNRRTDNSKERLVESAAINKSLFVMSQCIDAISRGDKRVPYRESKMTRILSLGQNNGITIMILNLAPLRSYHLDTLSSLNVSSRAKRIEVREIENEVVFKQMPRGALLAAAGATGGGAGVARQPLRALTSNTAITVPGAAAKPTVDPGKPVKAFSVYTDRSRPGPRPLATASTNNMLQTRQLHSTKLIPEPSAPSARHTKIARPALGSKSHAVPAISAAQIEAMVERKVNEILALRAAQAEVEALQAATPTPAPVVQPDIAEAVQRRLDVLERRIEHEDRRNDGRSDGLKLLLAAKQAKEAGDEPKALELYEKALPFFPREVKLVVKIEKLRAKLAVPGDEVETREMEMKKGRKASVVAKNASNDEYDPAEAEKNGGDGGDDDDDIVVVVAAKPKAKARKSKTTKISPEEFSSLASTDGPASPRTRQLLDIVNSRDPAQIRSLSGFGAKRAADLVEQLRLMAEQLVLEEHQGQGQDEDEDEGQRQLEIESLEQLRMVPGMGGRIIDRAYEGLAPVGRA